MKNLPSPWAYPVFDAERLTRVLSPVISLDRTEPVRHQPNGALILLAGRVSTVVLVGEQMSVDHSVIKQGHHSSVYGCKPGDVVVVITQSWWTPTPTPGGWGR